MVNTAEKVRYVRQIANDRWKQYHEAKEPFRRIFGIELDEYMDMKTTLGIMTGFDVIKFDEEFIKPKPNQNTRDAIKQKYGKEAVKLIISLF